MLGASKHNEVATPASSRCRLFSDDTLVQVTPAFTQPPSVVNVSPRDPIHFPDDHFIFSPFGLCCRNSQCKNRPQVQLNLRRVQVHLKKQGLPHNVNDVRQILQVYDERIEAAILSGSIENYRYDNIVYVGYACVCGSFFPNRIDTAKRHCKSSGCDEHKIQKCEAMKMCSLLTFSIEALKGRRNNLTMIMQEKFWSLSCQTLSNTIVLTPTCMYH
jgi:hypothetical protein